MKYKFSKSNPSWYTGLYEEDKNVIRLRSDEKVNFKYPQRNCAKKLILKNAQDSQPKQKGVYFIGQDKTIKKREIIYIA